MRFPRCLVIDRTTMNSWEDAQFIARVNATGIERRMTVLGREADVGCFVLLQEILHPVWGRMWDEASTLQEIYRNLKDLSCSLAFLRLRQRPQSASLIHALSLNSAVRRPRIGELRRSSEAAAED